MNTEVVYKARYAAISICHRRQKACCRARPKVYVFKSHNPRCGYSFRFGLSFFFDSHSSDGQSEILEKKEKHQACWTRLFGPIKTFQSRTRLFLSSTPHKRLSYGDSPLFVYVYKYPRQRIKCETKPQQCLCI